MPIPKIRFRAAVLLCAILFLTASCRVSTISPYNALLAMCQAEKPLPAGRIYVRSVSPEDSAYLSDALLIAMFGNGSMPPAMDEVADAACFFSYIHPCEFAVFLCKSVDSTQAVSEMCLRRLDSLKNYRSYDGLDEPTVAAYLEQASVTVRGKYVILCVSSDPAAALRAFRKAG